MKAMFDGSNILTKLGPCLMLGGEEGGSQSRAPAPTITAHSIWWQLSYPWVGGWVGGFEVV